MTEIRLNLITRTWVIIAKEKGKKPEDFIERRVKKRHPEFLETCPFCLGNESKTPDEVFRINGDKEWKIRVVRNKFSRLSEEGERKRWDIGLKKGVHGVGKHELIIETPNHNLTTTTMPTEQFKNLIQAYKDRFVDIYKDPKVEYVIIFKNNGPLAGSSIEHPLSQIVGIPVTPLQIRERFEGYMKFFDETGNCLMCKTIDDELNDGSRVIFDTEHFVSFIPYAALSAFHLWIFPKRHSGSFADIRQEEMQDLAKNLKLTMAKICYGLDFPDFNYCIRSGNPNSTDSEFIHWYISIVPRVEMTTGFELGSGMHVNPLLPEMGAEFLRNIKIPECHT